MHVRSADCRSLQASCKNNFSRKAHKKTCHFCKAFFLSFVQGGPLRGPSSDSREPTISGRDSTDIHLGTSGTAPSSLLLFRRCKRSGASRFIGGLGLLWFLLALCLARPCPIFTTLALALALWLLIRDSLLIFCIPSTASATTTFAPSL